MYLSPQLTQACVQPAEKGSHRQLNKEIASEIQPVRGARAGYPTRHRESLAEYFDDFA